MNTPTVAPDAPATPVATPRVETPSRVIDDPLLAGLAEDLAPLIKASTEAADASAPPVAPVIVAVPDPAPETPAAPATMPAPAKVVVKPKPDARAVAEEVYDRKRAEERRSESLPVPPPKPPEAKPATVDTSMLSPEQRDELADAQHSEALDPANKGRAEKLAKFYADCDAYVATNKSDPDRTFDANDAEFIKWVKDNKPAWKPGERDKVRTDRIEKAAEDRAVKRLEPEVTQARREAREAKMAPVIERGLAEFKKEIDKSAETDDPLAREVYQTFADSASDMANTYLRLIHGVDDMGEQTAPEIREKQDWMIRFIVAKGDHFAAHGGDARVRDGKSFVAPAEYADLVRDQSPKLASVWTFRKDDVLKHLREHAVSMAAMRVKAEEELASKRGYVKVKPVPKQAEAPTPTAGPKATSSPVPSATEKVGDIGGSHPGREIIATLGLPAV